MKPVRIKLEEMMRRNFDKDECHKLTMDLFEHRTYTKERAYIEGYRAAILEILESCPDTPVREFHEKFEHPVEFFPKVPDTPTRILRVKLIVEEAMEYANASAIQVFFRGHRLDGVGNSEEFTFRPALYRKPNITEAADGLGDLRYVVDGANLCWGFPQEEILYEIHRSNMTKLGEDGKPIYGPDKKVKKGPNYEGPKIEEILIEKGWVKDE